MNTNPDTPLNPGDDAPRGVPGVGENICQECHGTGEIMDGEECASCAGTGIVIEGIGGG